MAGTGLGLAISRVLAKLSWAAKFSFRSATGPAGSFTLYLPQIYVGPDVRKSVSRASGRDFRFAAYRRS
jgi:hypothetical protein